MKLYKNWNRYSKQRQIDCKNTWTILLWILLAIGMSVVKENFTTPTKIISPLSNKVFAQESKPATGILTPAPVTDEEIFSYAIKVWGKEGKAVLIKMFNCFSGESGWNFKAIHKNDNGTIDAGLAQVNDIHGMSLEDRLDYKKNIDKAYQIYLGRGRSFDAWYAGGCR